MIKNLIKQVTPPILWNALRRQIVTLPPSVTCEGQFKSFDEVFHQYRETTRYHSGTSLNPDYEQAVLKLRCHESGEDPADTAQLTRLNFLPTVLAMTPDSITSILDVGGGMGVSYIDLLFSLPRNRYTMTVVELAETAALGRQLFHSYKDIQFAERLPAAGSRFDLVNFGSSLQYFENYREVLKEATTYRAKAIIVSYTSMGPAETFVAAQVNMPGRVIPRMVFNFEEIANLLSENGYVMVHKSLNYTNGIDFSNYADPVRRTRHWNLVFRAA